MILGLSQTAEWEKGFGICTVKCLTGKEVKHENYNTEVIVQHITIWKIKLVKKWYKNDILYIIKYNLSLL